MDMPEKSPARQENALKVVDCDVHPYVKDGIKTGRPGGFWTPATMFDDRFIARLTRYAGLRFERL